ncbi:L-type lectin-domain containing receptor kinase S.4 [Cryptomeria japonica]|uniref:L-type lectin-domain containing receptor kinase S.4 n=1 Tax=Cryptomeria japonica TaxID=3369 RepID=UPI0025AD5356|nr:L-type lectin-domain containing receptor kinase S.4 [Cryptomeria japonica]XP_057845856.1 L-type lectin-domain containing receptor kinase S.4 [Cryptomeria japonica]XP_057845858.1 L-type lectin-domain containing receptor kinase S.4 [Cryptomeria japonica]XP_057845859.1 L-type lectin-domain containing receptor kinase S.4 [Cryptomeria japonica]XP_057845860.1 L-type lectin-domain containing receptor kinase S.4 [Cryptomeria japonica]XP_059065706.1 L-type lectin-domain containing receptor kinase S.
MPDAQTFILLAFVFYLSLYFISVPAQQQQRNSADFIFEGFKDSNLSLSGMAHIDSRGILELTNVTQQMLGHAVYPIPLQFRNVSSNSTFSFSTTFVMSILPEHPTLGGHGLAFVVTPSRSFQGSLPAQYLGLFNSSNKGVAYNHIFAVEFDTVQDFEFKDIDDNHVGVDINSPISNKSATAAYTNEKGLYQKFDLKAQKNIQCWIEFDGGENSLNVSLIPGGMTRPKVPLISMHFDLSEVVEEFMYVGFSSSTGLFSSSHSILGWSFRMNGPARDLNLTNLPTVSESQSKDKIRLIIGASVAAVVVMTLAVFAGVHFVRRLRDVEVIEDWELDYGPQRFSYKELRIATKGFSDRELLGVGGFGRVYKGVLPRSGLEVAVKRVSRESTQGLREFVAEISSIGRLRHRNLVQLQGWCKYKEELLLVYDYMPNGSLDSFLFGDKKNTLSWEQRYMILKGVASGLLYLHEEWEQQVVHRDVKASNVLLDADMNGRLGDFGLSRLYEHGCNPHTTNVVGTFGYLAPELARTGKPTTCTDVFAFGVLLLEVACGRRPIEPKYSPEEVVLVEWVWEMYSKGKILEVIDLKLQKEYVVREAEFVLQLGLLCTHPRPEARPCIRQVVQILAGDMLLPALPSEAPSTGTTQFFDDCVNLFSSDEHGAFNVISHASASSDGRQTLAPDRTPLIFP